MNKTLLLTTHGIMTLVIILLPAKPGVASVMLFFPTCAGFMNCLVAKINRRGEQSALLHERI